MGKRGRKHSNLEKEERILFLLDCSSKGIKGTSDLFRFFSSKYPDLTKRQFQYDLKDAKDRIREYHSEDVDFLIVDLVKHLWELYNKSLKIQDYRECRAVIKTISEITGASAAHRIEIGITTNLENHPVNNMPEEKAREFAKYIFNDN